MIKVYVHYRSCTYNPEHEEQITTDTEMVFTFNTFSLHKVAKKIMQYCKKDERVINIIFQYNEPYFEDLGSCELDFNQMRESLIDLINREEDTQ